MAPSLHSLKLKTLKFLSAVDFPAQETATVALVKRKSGGNSIAGKFRVTKLDEELGIVFGWALTDSTKAGAYFDLQGDHVIADNDLIKAALEFVRSGAAADEMHNRSDEGGWVPFVLPVDKSVAEWLKIDQTGLIAGMQPTPEVFAKFKSGEYTGFSIDGTGERSKASKGDARKAMALTTAINGHAHALYCAESEGGETSYQTSDGAEYSHTHAWMRLPDGSIAIGESEGHTHALVAIQWTPVVVEAPASVTVAVSARAPQSPVAPPAQPVVKNAPQETSMTPEQIAKLQSDLAAVTAERDLLKKQADEAAIKAADTVEYKALDGTEYRKSAGDHVIALAKRADAAERKAGEVELEKRAAKLFKHSKGTARAHAALLKAAEAMEGELKTEALQVLAAGDGALAITQESVGHLGGGDPESPAAQLDRMAEKVAKDKGIALSKAYAEVLKTADGKRLYAEAERAKQPTH